MKESISEKALSVIVDLIAENKSKYDSICSLKDRLYDQKERLDVNDLVFHNDQIGKVIEIHYRKIVLSIENNRVEIYNSDELQNLKKLTSDHIRIYLMYESKKPKQ